MTMMLHSTATATLFTLFIAATLLTTVSEAFAPSQSQRASYFRYSALSAAKNRESWTFNPLDVNDLSPVDTLFRRGVIPFSIRLFQEERYEEAVLEFMRKDGCDRATAQRNMDAFFNDPSGWVVKRGRIRDLGEDFGDINASTGVQKRPVFSVLWAAFVFWFFLSFLPTRVNELGGVQPSLPENGMCKYPVRTVDGLKCRERDSFDEFSMI